MAEQTHAEVNESLRKEIADLKAQLAEGKRKYVPTLSELLDRLSINQIKEVKILDHKSEYAQEISQIVDDIDLILKSEQIVFDGRMLRALIILSQYNLHIWHGESNFRRGIKEGNDLELTHSLNGVRNRAKNIIQDALGGRKDYKTDCLAAEFTAWEPSWGNK